VNVIQRGLLFGGITAATIATPAFGQILPLVASQGATAAITSPAGAATSGAPSASPGPYDTPSATPLAVTPMPLTTSTPIVTPTPGASGRAITLKPRLTQFYEGLTAGESDLGFEYGAKVDLLINADLAKLGLWRGLSMTVHPEYNFGSSVNRRGGGGVAVNTALRFPGMNDFDFSSVYLGQTFPSASLLVGKINMVDLSASSPFRGGAGIDSFWNITFAAPPSGTVPPYLFGALLTLRTKGPTYGLWVYDPDSQINQSGLNDPFANGVTIRGSVTFPLRAGQPLSGHQGFVALYSTQPGTDLASLGDTFLPPPAGGTVLKNGRYYFNYSLDKYLYQSQADPNQGWGLFGQFGISDGNPNNLYWSAFTGVGGTGLIPGRSRDNWGVGLYYDAPSNYLKQPLPMMPTYRNEFGSELFYNFEVKQGVTLGADLQIIRPALGTTTTVVPGVRAMVEF